MISKQKHRQDLYARAQQYIPGGVNSPVRSFAGVNSTPVFMQRGDGACLYDVDGKQYIDFICSWGPLILGHAHSKVMTRVKTAVEQGLGFGTVTEIEIQMAEKICALMPSIELIRMVNSGTEATMSAIRLARGYNGRDKIIKFTGCYHGHSDAVLVDAGSGALTFGVPSSPGVPHDLAKHTLVADFNDLDSVRRLFATYPEEIACVIVEPVAGNMNCVPADPKFLQGLRQLCDQYQALLIFDEVMTGFRVAIGGAQQVYAIKPDLTTLGKVIGGGLPVGAFGGRRDVMQTLAPLGPIYQAGTLSGNPVAMAAGLATLEEVSQPGFYQQLQHLTRHLLDGLTQLTDTYHIPFTSNAACSMFGFFFTECEQVTNYQQAVNCNIERFQQFFHGMLEAGVYFAPSAFESGFVSRAHSNALIDKTLNAAEHVLKRIA